MSYDDKTYEMTRICYERALNKGDEEEAEYWAKYFELLSLTAEIKNLCIIAKEYNRMPHELFNPSFPPSSIEMQIIIAFLNWHNSQLSGGIKSPGLSEAQLIARQRQGR